MIFDSDRPRIYLKQLPRGCVKMIIGLDGSLDGRRTGITVLAASFVIIVILASVNNAPLVPSRSSAATTELMMDSTSVVKSRVKSHWQHVRNELKLLQTNSDAHYQMLIGMLYV